MLLLAGRDADVAGHRDRHVLARRLAVDARAALGDQPPRLVLRGARGRGRPARRPGRSRRRPSASAAPRRPRLPRRSCAPSRPRLAAASSPCSIAVAASASAFLASLISAPSSASSRAISSSGRSVNRRRNLPTSASCGVPPELPVIVGAELVGVEPDRALRGLAHLAAVGGGDQRRGEAVELRCRRSRRPSSMPLTILPHWSEPPICSRQPRAPRQLEEVVGLEDHVVEFEEGQRLLAVEPQLDAVEGQHPVDREMRADVAQERDVVERVEPVGIVDHDRVGRAVAEGQEALEHAPDRGDVGVDRARR